MTEIKSCRPLQFQAKEAQPKQKPVPKPVEKTHLFCPHFTRAMFKVGDYGFDEDSGESYHLCLDCSRKEVADLRLGKGVRRDEART